ncbi:hypothetical protein JOC78_003200 [Bacillus ectoiniformans]|uniref:hypothetical protein n=1 Tax=Bacillus ectoiniformans TaxID=1494429 RepID=UPI0019596011|nr:hypothetical protein [Bacillus ectoiniformans]MBM7650216.1 hypothetical protein [Bacillus ectoiniformans]
MRMVNGVLPKIHGVKRKRNKIINIPETSKISVERSKDILDYFAISSTDKDLIQYIEQEVLWRALPIKDDIEYTDYPYSFDVVSLLFMLLNKGIDFREIMEIL